jgi:hypothetical protein
MDVWTTQTDVLSLKTSAAGYRACRAWARGREARLGGSKSIAPAPGRIRSHHRIRSGCRKPHEAKKAKAEAEVQEVPASLQVKCSED